MISARFKEIHALLQDATAAAKKAGDKEYGIVSQLRLICDELEIKADASEIAENLLHSQMADYLKVIEEDVSRVLRDLSRLSSGYDTSYFRQVMERDLRTLRINLYLVKSRIPVPYTDPSGGYSVSELASIIEWPAFLRLYNLSDANFLFESGYFGKQDKDNYDSLDESQKKCLLCLAIFPEEAEIQKRLLRIWWAAEGFVTLDHVDEILDIFVNRGFIEPVYKKGGRQASSSFKMHPLTRSLVIKLAQRAGFFDFELDAKLTDCRSRRACLAEETCLSYDEKEQQITNLKKLKALFNINGKQGLSNATSRWKKQTS
ncbi:hypothetical protein COLO4_20344 [Corchorus olitorius]|uniref:Uncharacterized protein n=1 Tax=Corchorus olitorius TaxID=93759 RepID=A0A1R3J084_9ROSI|nr:hypothetical protein COLO4_20344 [Corchorus olitorius]